MVVERVVREMFLRPGDYFVGDAGWRIRTLLGSCVSITLWHERLRIGAMSHFLLSTRPARADGTLDARYGDEALDLMFQDLGLAGVPVHECEAKIFGGGNMFPHQERGRGANVGETNGHAARAMLQAHRVPVRSESLFGLGHRQIIFDIRSGHVWARQVSPGDLAPQERT